MSKRLQIPIEPSDEEIIKYAAQKAGLSMAEWARRLLIEKAKELKKSQVEPSVALQKMFSLNAPIDDLESMLKDSFDRRYT